MSDILLKVHKIFSLWCCYFLLVAVFAITVYGSNVHAFANDPMSEKLQEVVSETVDHQMELQRLQREQTKLTLKLQIAKLQASIEQENSTVIAAKNLVVKEDIPKLQPNTAVSALKQPPEFFFYRNSYQHGSGAAVDEVQIRFNGSVFAVRKGAFVQLLGEITEVTPSTVSIKGVDGVLNRFDVNP